MTTLLIFIRIIEFFILFFGPSFIKRSLYRLYFVDTEYIYRLEDERRIQFVVTQNPSNYGRENKVVRLSIVPDMKNFKTLVYNSNTKRDCVYQLTVDSARLKIKDRRMLPENDVHVGLVRMIYSNLLGCRIRHLWPLRDFCNTSMFLSLKPFVSWYKCGLFVAKIVLVFVFLSPWFIRLWIFYMYEAPKREMTERVGLRYTDYLTSFLYSIHALVIMCVILVVDAVLYTVMAQATKMKLKDLLRECLYSAPVQGVMRYLIFIDDIMHRLMLNDARKQLKDLLRKCLRDMRELSASEVCAWSTSLMVLPLLECGVLGLLVFPLYFVILLITILPVFIYLIPWFNITSRLSSSILLLRPARLTDHRFRKLLATEEEPLEFSRSTDDSSERGQKLKGKENIIHIFAFSMYIVSFWFFFIPVTHCISFFVMMAMYTLMGIIVNAKSVLDLVTVVFMVVMYGRSTFNSVRDKYLAYHQQIHKQLLALKKDEIEAMAEALKEEKFALRVQGTLITSPDPDIRVIVKSGIPHWQTSGLLLFLDKRNTYTPEKFFYDTISLDYCGAPGPLYVAFTAAAWSFGYVLLFLFFVVVVFIALGSSYSVSPTIQFLATVAGGFALFLVRSVFKSPNPPSLQTDSIQFRSQFHQVINCYKEKWPVYDFTFTQVSPADRQLGSVFYQGSVSSLGEDDLDMIIDVSTEDSRNHGSLEV